MTELLCPPPGFSQGDDKSSLDFLPRRKWNGPELIQEGFMSDLKVALVVAGGSGMGAAAARKLAEDGYKVAILSSSGKGEKLAEELGYEAMRESEYNGSDVVLLRRNGPPKRM